MESLPTSISILSAALFFDTVEHRLSTLQPAHRYSTDWSKSSGM